MPTVLRRKSSKAQREAALRQRAEEMIRERAQSEQWRRETAEDIDAALAGQATPLVEVRRMLGHG